MQTFYTKSGWLTDYALSCGYKHFQRGISLESLMANRACYVVTRLQIDYNSPARVMHRRTTASLTEARKWFLEELRSAGYPLTKKLLQIGEGPYQNAIA